jgi:hypothetical protein
MLGIKRRRKLLASRLLGMFSGRESRISNAARYPFTVSTWRKK